MHTVSDLGTGLPTTMVRKTSVLLVMLFVCIVVPLQHTVHCAAIGINEELPSESAETLDNDQLRFDSDDFEDPEKDFVLDNEMSDTQRSGVVSDAYNGERNALLDVERVAKPTAVPQSVVTSSHSNVTVKTS